MIKPKHIILIVILIVVVFLLYRFRDRLFLKKSIENFYSDTTIFYTDIATNEQLAYVILELTYTDNCAASYQFLHGCCASIDSNGSDIVDNTGTYFDSIAPAPCNTIKNAFQVRDKPTKPTIDTNEFPSSSNCFTEPIKIERNDNNYVESNTCKPASYYINNICNLEKESTLYHLKKVLKNINDEYKIVNVNGLKQDLNIFQQEDNNLIEVSELNNISRLPYGLINDRVSDPTQTETQIKNKLAKLYEFQIKLNLIKSSNPEEDVPCPNLKLRIPTGLRVTGSDNKIDYKDIQYNYNINNIDRIMEFIYKNVDITITDNSITLFDKFYPETNDVYKSSFYHSPRKFTFSPNLSPNNNFIKKKYEEYKLNNFALTSTPPYTLQMESFLIHRNEVERTAVLKKKSHKEDNLQTRFSIFWDNVPPTTNNKDNTKLLILLRDPNLIEYYQDDSNSKPLIYWFAWNVNKDDFSIPEKSKSQLTSIESFTQLYPYQLFLPDSPQLTNNTDNSIVNLKLDVIPITDEINDKLTKLYQNPRMKESMFFHHKQFYHEMSKILQENSIPKENLTPIPSPSQSNNDNSLLEIPYQIRDKEGLNQIEDYLNTNNTNYKNETLTSFNYGELVYSITTDDKVIKLPHYTYYEIFVKPDIYNSPSQSIIDNRLDVFPSPTPTPEELLTNNNYTSEDNDIILSVDGNEVFSIVDGNYIYRIPYQTNIVKLKATAGCKVIIRPSVYKTLPLIWSSIKEDKLELSKASKIHLFFKSTDIITTSTDFIVESNSTTKYHSLFSKNNKKDFSLPNLSNNPEGTITFLPENFDIKEYKKQQALDFYNLGAYRINDVNTFNKTICRNDRSNSDNSHQILPTIKWDTTLSDTDIKYALEVFYYLPGTTTKKIVYLEWDIDNNELNYEGFKTIRESSPAPAPVTTSGNIKYGPGRDHIIQNIDLSTNKNNLYKEEFVRKDGRDCYVNVKNPSINPINIKINGNNKKMISIVNGILEGKPLNYIQLTKDTNDKYTGDNNYDNNGFILEYNTNLNIWQLWFQDENGIKEWVANQKISELIFNQKTDWVFAPKYNTNLVGNFDFFDYPNEFNKNKVIDTYKMQNLLESTLTINDITKGTSENSNERIYDCSYNKSKLKECDALNDSIDSPDVSYFKSTLFNIPNVSELSETGDLLKVNTDTGDLFFNLELRARVHAYKQNEDNSYDIDPDEDIILDKTTYPRLDKKLERLLSNQVKNNYLIQEAIDNIKTKIKNIQTDICKDKHKYLMLDEILSEILVNQGDLSKVPFPTMLTDLYSMDVFNMNREISDDLVGLFEEYISNKVYPQNYSSYGNLNLRQNETIINYQIPTNYNDLKCIQHNSEDVISSPNNNDDMKYQILKSQFYTNSKDIKKHIDNITKYLNEDKHYSKIIDCSSFQKNTLVEYNNYLSLLQDEGDLTKIDQLNNDTNIDLYLLDIDYITKPSTDLTPNPSPSTDLTPCPSDNAPSISYSSDARKYICSPDYILDIHKHILKILKFYEKVKEYINCSEPEKNCPSESTPIPSPSESSKTNIETIRNLVSKTTELNKIVKEKYETVCELEKALSPSNSEEEEEEGKQPAESKGLPPAAEVAKYYKTLFSKSNIFNRP